MFRAPPGAVDEPPAAELVALTPADDCAQSAALRKFNVANLKDGDTVYVTRSDDNGLKILAHDPELLAALAAAEDVMDENRTLLQALA